MNKQNRRLVVALILSLTASMPAQVAAHHHGTAVAGAAWSEFGDGMEKMHDGMMSVQPSGDNDVDFVALMLPHHQAAIDMARTELVYGKDPQMRRLAQEIITDQQSETELMQLWSKQHQSGSK